MTFPIYTKRANIKDKPEITFGFCLYSAFILKGLFLLMRKKPTKWLRNEIKNELKFPRGSLRSNLFK